MTHLAGILLQKERKNRNRNACFSLRCKRCTFKHSAQKTHQEKARQMSGNNRVQSPLYYSGVTPEHILLVPKGEPDDFLVPVRDLIPLPIDVLPVYGRGQRGTSRSPLFALPPAAPQQSPLLFAPAIPPPLPRFPKEEYPSPVPVYPQSNRSSPTLTVAPGQQSSRRAPLSRPHFQSPPLQLQEPRPSQREFRSPVQQPFGALVPVQNPEIEVSIEDRVAQIGNNLYEAERTLTAVEMTQIPDDYVTAMPNLRVVNKQLMTGKRGGVYYVNEKGKQVYLKTNQKGQCKDGSLPGISGGCPNFKNYNRRKPVQKSFRPPRMFVYGAGSASYKTDEEQEE